MNILKNLRHFTGKHVVVLLTRKCNLSCGWCNVVNQDYPDASVDEWKKEIRLFDKFNVANITVMGGEPTEYQGLFELLSYMKENTRATVSMVTNGIKIRDDGKYREKLADIGLDLLVVSMNSKKELGKLPLYARNFASVIVNTIVSKENIREIPGMVTEVSAYSNCFFDPIVLQTDENAFSKKANEALLPDIEDVKEVSRKLVEMKFLGYLIVSTFSYLNKMPDYVSGWRWKCRKNAFKKFFALNNDTRIMVCQGTKPLDYKLSQLTDPDNMKQFREQVKESAGNCSGCLYNCTYNSSVNPISKLIGFMPMTPRIIKQALTKR
ncbi:MAG: radical SAM protein [Candidatus Altiarchaeota archaeon]